MRSFFSRSRPAGNGDGLSPPEYEGHRRRMVERQIRRRGITDPVVLAAMLEVPRHRFLPPDLADSAYGDHALPIGEGQTISQPYIVALMTAALRPTPGLRVLEVGTGSGYQAAVLAACGMDVFSVERIPALYEAARTNLEEAGYGDRVHLALADGALGWPDRAPFDRILVAAATPDIPDVLWDQLRTDGLVVAPVGDPYLQTIYRLTKRADGNVRKEALEGARFVPLVREPEG